MRRGRYIALGALLVITLGSLATTAGYAWYLRSDGYRRYCSAYLSTSLDLPSEIGRVVPRSFSSREFQDVAVWLPGRRGKALSCRRALLTVTPKPENREAYEIELLGGTCEVSTRTWLREDYRRVIESGLKPGFDPGGPQRVRFGGMDLVFEHERFRGSLEDAHGVVVFEGLDHGWTTIECQSLNGWIAPEPATLNAQFSPRSGGIRIDGLKLQVPKLPVKVLRLGELMGVPVKSGTFSGQMAYGETDGIQRASLSGTCYDASLAEWTAGLTTPPWRGTCAELELKELTLENRRPQRLAFRGVLTGVVLGDVLAPLGLADIGGELVLRVREVDLSPDGIDKLVASGQCTGVSLAKVTQALGWGTMSGTASLNLTDLTVEHNRLRSLEARIQVEDKGEAKWIEGKLLTQAASRALKLNLPPVLPERIEYTQLGLRLDVRDESLHVFGTHGEHEKTILTVRMFGSDVPLLFEPEQPFDLTVWLDQLRQQGAAYLRSRLDALDALQSRPASSPATGRSGRPPSRP
jgi:hypothetical protein